MGDTRSQGERRSIPAPPDVARGVSSGVSAGVTVYTLAMLLDRHGRVEGDHVERYLGEVDSATLVADGRRIATTRIVKDGARILGAAGAFLAVATPEQREEMPLIDERFIAAGLSAVARADDAQRALDAHRGGSKRDRALAKDRGEKSVTRARRRRDTMHQALLTLAGASPDLRQEVFDATGAAEDSAQVADSLERQVKLGQRLVRTAKERGIPCALDKAYFTKTLAIAADARRLGAEADAPASSDGVNQGEVNRRDGVALWFLKRVVDTFDAAHEADPSVPRLPVLSLRSVLRRGTRTKKHDAAKPMPDAPKPA